MASIVIDNYNYEPFIGKAIESALRQTYPSVEVVVVDDGSTDGSRQVIDRFRHRVVAVEQVNGGQGAAVNAGFAVSRGDLVIFLDADDELGPQAVERVVRHLRPGVAKVHFRLDAVDKDGAPLGFTNPSESQPLAVGSVVPELLSRGRYTTPVMSGNAFTRDVLERILPMPAAQWRISADGYLVTAAPFHGTVVAVEERLGAYRIHGANAWAPDTIEAVNLPRRIQHDLAKYALVEALAAANGLPAPRHLELKDHAHLRNRIASLRLDPQRHPVRDDRRWRLAWWGMVRTVLSSDLDARRRLIFAIWFAVVSFAPRPLARRAILLLYVPQSRGRVPWSTAGARDHRGPRPPDGARGSGRASAVTPALGRRRTWRPPVGRRSARARDPDPAGPARPPHR
jgi:glycosyltransferase involved in cell wall biosynthesis